MSAGTYNVISDFNTTEKAHDGYLSTDPYWVIAVVRLGMPLSFSRKLMASVTNDVSQGAITRAVKPMVITDDCLQISTQSNKRSHTKSLSATLKMTDVNYLVELLPGDWVLAWIVNNKPDFESLLHRLDRVTIDEGSACNKFKDGLKFVGRIHSTRLHVEVDRSSGTKTANCSLQCIGFGELETTFFYDNSLASVDLLEKNLGAWLTRLGVEYQTLFRDDVVAGIEQNNVNKIIPALLDLIVGKGPAKRPILVEGLDGKTATATPTLDNSAPFAYLIPLQVGKLLGVQAGSKADLVMSYADILELLQGVQKYANKSDWNVFVPQLSKSNGRRRVTTEQMLGTFLPFFPELTNQPLWAILNRYLNPTVNEMYTCLRVNPEGQVMPTLVLRQIPFTTEAFTPDAKNPGSTASNGTIPYTKFVSEMPRWQIPATMIYSVDVGRSDATRFNFVHVYGQSSYAANNNSIPNQIVLNPPIRDDLDIMRSGLRSYMTTVECFVNDQIGQVPTTWMKLVADWTMGSHLTLNGTITCLGIQSPIAEGDNLEFDGVVYHIEAVNHNAAITGNGNKSWSTTLHLTNGMRASLGTEEEKAAAKEAPLYPGFRLDDNTVYNPGLSLEQRLTKDGNSDSAKVPGDFVQDSTANEVARSEGPSQLNPATATKAPAQKGASSSKRRRKS